MARHCRSDPDFVEDPASEATIDALDYNVVKCSRAKTLKCSREGGSCTSASATSKYKWMRGTLAQLPSAQSHVHLAHDAHEMCGMSSSEQTIHH